jgi:hypothetical protein
MRVAMQKDHPNMVAIRQLRRNASSALEPREGPEPARSEPPAQPEADDIACETAEPADRNQGTEAQRARMGGVAREQAEQQAVRGCIREYETVDRFAMLANEIKERGEVCRKQQGLKRDACVIPPMSGRHDWLPLRKRQGHGTDWQAAPM